jgi:hypothetical protein
MKANFITILILCTTFLAYAQKSKTTIQKSSVETTNKKTKTIWAYWGDNTYGDKNMTKRVFDSLIKTPLQSVDSSKKTYSVLSFDMVLTERNLYEDSIGNAIIVPDYSSYNNKGAVMNENHLSYILNHSKIGDTLFINDVIVKDDKDLVFKLKSFKVTIKK